MQIRRERTDSCGIAFSLTLPDVPQIPSRIRHGPAKPTAGELDQASCPPVQRIQTPPQPVELAGQAMILYRPTGGVQDFRFIPRAARTNRVFDDFLCGRSWYL